MPDPNDYPRIQFNATPIIDKIRARENQGGSEHLTARRDLQRYYKLLEASRPTLQFEQAKLLCDLLNGVIFEPIDRAPQLLQIEVQDAPDRLFEKWDVSRDKIEQRIADFSDAEAYATIDAVERFWNEPNETSVVDVGLCGSGDAELTPRKTPPHWKKRAPGPPFGGFLLRRALPLSRSQSSPNMVCCSPPAFQWA